VNLNKKLIVLALASTVSISASAAVETFTASVTALTEPTIVNGTPIVFGTMGLAVGSACVMDNAGGVTGDCDATDVNIAVGGITISNLITSSNISITVATGVGANVTYTPVYDIAGAVAAVSDAPADIAQSVTVAAGDADIVLTNFGTMSVDTTLDAGIAYTADYNVTVVFE